MGMSDAKREIQEDIEERLMAGGYFSSFPPELRCNLVDEGVGKAVDMLETYERHPD